MTRPIISILPTGSGALPRQLTHRCRTESAYTSCLATLTDIFHQMSATAKRRMILQTSPQSERRETVKDKGVDGPNPPTPCAVNKNGCAKRTHLYSMFQSGAYAATHVLQHRPLIRLIYRITCRPYPLFRQHHRSAGLPSLNRDPTTHHLGWPCRSTAGSCQTIRQADRFALHPT